MIKKYRILLLTLASAMTVNAQWSVLEDDPRPRTPSYLFHVFSKADWNKSNFATEKELQWFRDAKYGMFLCFGLSTYKNADLSWNICQVKKAPDTGTGPYPVSEWSSWTKHFRVPDFDAKKLIGYAQEAGMTYIVVVVKHHDGFHLWDTRQSEFKVTNTPFGRDYLKEIAEACHAAGLKLGIYYSQRDWFHPDYAPTEPKSEKHQRYVAYQNKAVRELCMNYGKVDIFWFDAVYWDGMFTAEMWDAENLTRMIRELQPGIVINNRASVPGDFDTPEQRIGMFQNHRPWESCMCLCASWSYSETPSKTSKDVVQMLVSTLCGDGNMLLSWGPKWSGAFDEKQVESLKGAGAWVKKNKEAIYGTRGGPWRPAKWGGSVYRDKTVYLHVFKVPDGNKLVLADLKQKVLKAAIHGGAEIPFTQKGEHVELTLPADQQDTLCTVVELAVDSQITEIIPVKQRKSIFEDPEYGDLISEKATLRISSTCEWEEIWKQTNLDDCWEIPVTRFVAGAHIPGKDARYVKIERRLEQPDNFHLQKVKIYGHGNSVGVHIN